MAGGKKFSTCDLPAACSAPTFASEIRQERAQQMASFICVFCKMLAGLPAWGRSCSGCELKKSWFTFSNPTATAATPLRSVEKCEKFALRMLPTAKETYNARNTWLRSRGGAGELLHLVWLNGQEQLGFLWVFTHDKVCKQQSKISLQVLTEVP